jgi:hypothetical protein
LHGLLDEAVDDEIIPSSPAAFTGRGPHHRKLLNLAATPAERDRGVKALMPDELDRLLFATRQVVPSSHRLFLTMACAWAKPWPLNGRTSTSIGARSRSSAHWR